MPEKLTSTNISPEDTAMSNLIRWAKIHVWGRVLHTLIWWGKSLSDTFQWFLKTTNISVNIDEWSSQAIDEFCQNDSWVMILNHPNSNFADYIPFLAQIPEEILAKSTFFAWKHTVPMFKREFWDAYDFIEASFDSVSEAKTWLKKLEWAIEKVEKWDWYIFIIPWWAESEGSEIHEWFKALFKKIIQRLPQSTALLAGKITYLNIVEYSEVYKRVLKWKVWINQEPITATLQAKNVTTWDFNQDGWKEMRENYEGLFSS